MQALIMVSSDLHARPREGRDQRRFPSNSRNAAVFDGSRRGSTGRARAHQTYQITAHACRSRPKMTLPRVLNHSSLTGDALQAVTRALERLRSIDQIAPLVALPHPLFVIGRVMTFDDGLHVVLAIRPADSFAVAFGIDCEGSILGVSIWDEPPDACATVLDAAHWRPAAVAADDVQRTAPCRFGEHVARPLWDGGHRQPRVPVG
jgi:hypothetical protein